MIEFILISLLAVCYSLYRIERFKAQLYEKEMKFYQRLWNESDKHKSELIDQFKYIMDNPENPMKL